MIFENKLDNNILLHNFIPQYPNRHVLKKKVENLTEQLIRFIP